MGRFEEIAKGCVKGLSWINNKANEEMQRRYDKIQRYKDRYADIDDMDTLRRKYQRASSVEEKYAIKQLAEALAEKRNEN